VTRELLAWHSSHASLDTALHGLGTFATSAGFGGAAAVTAALIAARQVGKTRKVEALWARFQWVIDQIGGQTAAAADGQTAAAPDGQPPSAPGKYTLTSNEATVMLAAIRKRCRWIDKHLRDLVDQVLWTIFVETTKARKSGPHKANENLSTDTGRHGKKETEATGSAEKGGQ
jgi:hypothetical protein